MTDEVDGADCTPLELVPGTPWPSLSSLLERLEKLDGLRQLAEQRGDAEAVAILADKVDSLRKRIVAQRLERASPKRGIQPAGHPDRPPTTEFDTFETTIVRQNY